MKKPHQEGRCTLAPGNTWSECLCCHIDPADRPCAACAGCAHSAEECEGCAQEWAARRDVPAFFDAYIETALWSSTDNSDDSGGEPLDKNYDRSNLSERAIENAARECIAFWSAWGSAILAAKCRRPSGGSNAKRAGHDFWLTRNGHGAGFWDGDWRDSPRVFQSELLETTLTIASKRFGGVDLYVTDDGEIDDAREVAS
jgi:hypothetical protein